MSERETKLEGYALCLVQIGHQEKIVSTYIEVPAIYTSDWQVDGGFSHDEGWFDYDLNDATLLYPDEYDIIHAYGNKKEGTKVIDKLIRVFEADLQEKE